MKKFKPEYQCSGQLESSAGLQSRNANRLERRSRLGDPIFFTVFGGLGTAYILLILALVVSMLVYALPTEVRDIYQRSNVVYATIITVWSTLEQIWHTLERPDIAYATLMSLTSCTITALLSLWVAVPIGYLMSRYSFRGKHVVDAVLDLPIALPPLVIGLALLIFFRLMPPYLERAIVFEVPAIIVAQFTVAAAFAVRALRVTFDQIPDRLERVAMTLGASRSQAFWTVVFPQAQRGMLAAMALAWARALGEFGPLLIFAGAVEMRTEVLTTSVYLEMQAGDLSAALSISLVMVICALGALIAVRVLGLESSRLER